MLYEAPHRLQKTLKLLEETLGADRSITVCKEITKKHESFVKTTIGEALELYTSGAEEPRGEYVLVIGGKSRKEIEEEIKNKWDSISIEDHIRKYLDEGRTKKEAVKLVAEERGIPKRDVYTVSIEME